MTASYIPCYVLMGMLFFMVFVCLPIAKNTTNISQIYHKSTTKCDIVPQKCDIVPQKCDIVLQKGVVYYKM